MRKILGTCLNVITNLTKDCIKCIHVLENKRSDLHTLMQTKLAFSLEQTISFAKLGYEMDYLGDNTDGGLIYYTMFKYCTRCVQTVLTDSSIQVCPCSCCIPLWSRIPSMWRLMKSLFTGSRNWVASTKKLGSERHKCGGRHFLNAFCWGTY